MGIILLALGVVLMAAACTYQPPYPTEGVSSFWTDDASIEQAAEEALRRWTDAGVVAMASVTINADRKGVPIRYMSGKKMEKACNTKDPEGLGRLPTACTSYSASDGHVDGIFVDKEQDYEKIVASLMHEFVHVVLNLREHNPKEEGLFASAGKSEMTQSDLDWICARAQCIDAHLPPPKGDPRAKEKEGKGAGAGGG